MSAKKIPAKKTLAKKAPAKKTVKKAVAKTSNFQKLVAADVIQPDGESKLDQKIINKLSAAEVNTLIKLRKKLGPLPGVGTFAAAAIGGGDGDGLSPNFPV